MWCRRSPLRRLDPLGAHKYDGVDVDPMEAVFVPVHTSSLQKRVAYAIKADKYLEWSHADKGNYTWLVRRRRRGSSGLLWLIRAHC
jgi:hypothetical protein